MIPVKNNIAEIEILYKNPLKKWERKKIASSRDAYILSLPFFASLIDYKEQFKILLLNNGNEILGIASVGDGGITGTLVDIRLIFQNALKAHACGIILLHNHPSGTLRPSEADKRLTKKVKEAGDFLDIKVLDHLILTAENYYSFADEGIL